MLISVKSSDAAEELNKRLSSKSCKLVSSEDRLGLTVCESDCCSDADLTVIAVAIGLDDAVAWRGSVGGAKLDALTMQYEHSAMRITVVFISNMSRREVLRVAKKTLSERCCEGKIGGCVVGGAPLLRWSDCEWTVGVSQREKNEDDARMTSVTK